MTGRRGTVGGGIYGVGVAVILQLTLPARPDITVRVLDAPSLVCKVSVAMPPGRYRPSAAQAMAHALSEVGAQLVDEVSHALSARPAARA